MNFLAYNFNNYELIEDCFFRSLNFSFYDAMTSKRAYSDIRPQAEVRAEIERCRGTYFDPDIANIMLRMIDEDKNYSMREQL